MESHDEMERAKLVLNTVLAETGTIENPEAIEIIPNTRWFLRCFLLGHDWEYKGNFFVYNGGRSWKLHVCKRCNKRAVW